MRKIQEIFNFDNIGGKIKSFTKWSCWISILIIWIATPIVCIISLFNEETAPLFILIPIAAALYSVCAWIGSWTMYAFGEFVEDIHAMKYNSQIKNIDKNVEILATPMIREAKEKAKREAEEKAKRAAEEKAKREAEEKERRKTEGYVCELSQYDGYIGNVNNIEAFSWGDGGTPQTKDFYKPYIKKDFLYIPIFLCCISKYAIEFSGNSGIASTNETFDKTVPTKVVYESKIVDNKGAGTYFEVGISLNDLEVQKPKNLYIRFDFLVGGQREVFEAGFDFTW